jgi:dGTPase
MNNIMQFADFATKADKSRGRLYNESADINISQSDSIVNSQWQFAIDYQRIINCNAFRRLQYKTQVFVNHEGDHYRTRLTHSLEVAEISRFIAKKLRINADLAEIIALAHDLGHSAFGHAGEEMLNSKMQDFGGFCHNAHGLKLLTKIECQFINFVGLNLTWESLEGIVKHNGAMIDNSKIASYILQFNQIYDLELYNQPSLEAQIAAIADDIAYNNHDIEDALRANLFKIEDLLKLPIIGDIYTKIINENQNIRRELLVAEAKRIITKIMIEDVINNSIANISQYQIATDGDVRKCDKKIVDFSREMQEVVFIVKKFLLDRAYRHNLVNDMTKRAKEVVSFLFDYYFQNPDKINYSLINNKDNIKKLSSLNNQEIAELISDYIAGMTDRFALNQYNVISNLK